jgi:hypothetical protein
MFAHAGKVGFAAPLDAGAIKIDEAGVEAPTAGNMLTGKPLPRDLVSAIHNPLDHRGKCLGPHRPIVQLVGRLKVAQARKLPVPKPIHWPKQAALDLAFGQGAFVRVPLFPQRFQAGQILAQLAVVTGGEGPRLPDKARSTEWRRAMSGGSTRAVAGPTTGTRDLG